MPGWTRYTLPVDRRDRVAPPTEPPEPTDRMRFSGRKLVFILFVLVPVILVLFVVLLHGLGS